MTIDPRLLTDPNQVTPDTQVTPGELATPGSFIGGQTQLGKTYSDAVTSVDDQMNVQFSELIEVASKSLQKGVDAEVNWQIYGQPKLDAKEILKFDGEMARINQAVLEGKTEYTLSDGTVHKLDPKSRFELETMLHAQFFGDNEDSDEMAIASNKHYTEITSRVTDGHKLNMQNIVASTVLEIESIKREIPFLDPAKAAELITPILDQRLRDLQSIPNSAQNQDWEAAVSEIHRMQLEVINNNSNFQLETFSEAVEESSVQLLNNLKDSIDNVRISGGNADNEIGGAILSAFPLDEMDDEQRKLFFEDIGVNLINGRLVPAQGGEFERLLGPNANKFNYKRVIAAYAKHAYITLMKGETDNINQLNGSGDHFAKQVTASLTGELNAIGENLIKANRANAQREATIRFQGLQEEVSQNGILNVSSSTLGEFVSGSMVGMNVKPSQAIRSTAIKLASDTKQGETVHDNLMVVLNSTVDYLEKTNISLLTSLLKEEGIELEGAYNEDNKLTDTTKEKLLDKLRTASLSSMSEKIEFAEGEKLNNKLVKAENKFKESQVTKKDIRTRSHQIIKEINSILKEFTGKEFTAEELQSWVSGEEMPAEIRKLPSAFRNKIAKVVQEQDVILIKDANEETKVPTWVTGFKASDAVSDPERTDANYFVTELAKDLKEYQNDPNNTEPFDPSAWMQKSFDWFDQADSQFQADFVTAASMLLAQEKLANTIVTQLEETGLSSGVDADILETLAIDPVEETLQGIMRKYTDPKTGVLSQEGTARLAAKLAYTFNPSRPNTDTLRQEFQRFVNSTLQDITTNRDNPRSQANIRALVSIFKLASASGMRKIYETMYDENGQLINPSIKVPVQDGIISRSPLAPEPSGAWWGRIEDTSTQVAMAFLDRLVSNITPDVNMTSVIDRSAGDVITMVNLARSAFTKESSQRFLPPKAQENLRVILKEGGKGESALNTSTLTEQLGVINGSIATTVPTVDKMNAFANVFYVMGSSDKNSDPFGENYHKETARAIIHMANRRGINIPYNGRPMTEMVGNLPNNITSDEDAYNHVVKIGTQLLNSFVSINRDGTMELVPSLARTMVTDWSKNQDQTTTSRTGTDAYSNAIQTVDLLELSTFDDDAYDSAPVYDQDAYEVVRLHQGGTEHNSYNLPARSTGFGINNTNEPVTNETRERGNKEISKSAANERAISYLMASPSTASDKQAFIDARISFVFDVLNVEPSKENIEMISEYAREDRPNMHFFAQLQQDGLIPQYNNIDFFPDLQNKNARGLFYNKNEDRNKLFEIDLNQPSDQMHDINGNKYYSMNGFPVSSLLIYHSSGAKIGSVVSNTELNTMMDPDFTMKQLQQSSSPHPTRDLLDVIQRQRAAGPTNPPFFREGN